MSTTNTEQNERIRRTVRVAAEAAYEARLERALEKKGWDKRHLADWLILRGLRPTTRVIAEELEVDVRWLATGHVAHLQQAQR